VTFPGTVKVKNLTAQHPDYEKYLSLWEKIRLLFEGGPELRDNVTDFLFRRPAEKQDVYTSRCNEFTYTNILQAIIGWYISAEFKEAPTIVSRREDWQKLKESTDAVSTLDLDPKDKEKLEQFLKNCDGASHDFVKWWKESVESQVLLYQRVFVHVDLPDTDKVYDSLGQQFADGALRPRLRAFYPQDVINWAHDEQGNLEWLVIQATVTEQDGPLDDAEVYDRWWIFNLVEVAEYEYKRRPSEREAQQPPDTGEARLLSTKPHALSDQKRCPFFVHEITDDQWLGARLASPIVRYINLENTWDWALEQSNVAVLCVYSESDVDQLTKSETEFIKMGAKDKVEYLEPSGRAFEASSKRLSEMREDIYRNAYLIDQGRASSANAAMQSGLSKEQDKMPARDVLSSLGDNTRIAMQWVLQTVCKIATAKIDIDIQGLDFKDRYDATELDFLIKAEFIDVNSPTYKREKAKKLVRLVLPDANRAVHEQFDQEIDANPLPEELVQQDPNATPDGTAGMTGQKPTRGQQAASTVSQAAKQTLNNMGRLKQIEASRSIGDLNNAGV
jgi:hypothetical protein